MGGYPAVVETMQAPFSSLFYFMSTPSNMFYNSSATAAIRREDAAWFIEVDYAFER